MISNELLEKIIFISSKGEFIGKEILTKVFLENFNILDSQTKSNFRCLRFLETKEKDFRGTCDVDSGKIVIDLNQIYKDCKKGQITKLQQNLTIVVTLLHELEHLQEPYRISKNNFESKLLKYSILDNENLYHNYYDCNPSEKIAFSNSWFNLLENIKKYPDFIKKYFDTYAFVNNSYILNTKIGYYYIESAEKYNIPLFEYLLGTNQFKKIPELFVIKSVSNGESKIKKLDINTRMKYGLPVTKEDIEEMNKQKILIKDTK